MEKLIMEKLIMENIEAAIIIFFGAAMLYVSIVFVIISIIGWIKNKDIDDLDDE